MSGKINELTDMGIKLADKYRGKTVAFSQDMYSAQISPVMKDVLLFVQGHPKVCIGVFVFCVFDVMVLIKHFMEHESLLKLLLPLL